MVHVDHQHADLAAVAARALPFGVQVFVEIAAVAQPGQAVGIGQAAQFHIAFQQLLLALAQRLVGLVALHQRQVGARVVADARHQLDGIGQLDQVVIGAGGEGRALDGRIFLGGKHDDGNVARHRMVAIFLDQAQPVHARQHQILQDHRGPGLDGHGQRLVGVRAIVEVDVAFRGQGPPDGFGDHDLVVHQQNHGGMRIQVGRDRAVYGRVHGAFLELRTLSCFARRSGKSLDQARRDLVQRPDLHGGLHGRGRLRHAIDGAGGLVLGDGQAAALAQRLQPPAPSCPMPVNNTPTAIPRQCSATLWKNTSMEGRYKLSLGFSV